MVEKLTPEELAERWNLVVNTLTLANWRASKPKRGPDYIKIGSRVLYPIEAVIEWESKNTHSANDNEKGVKNAAKRTA